MGSLDISVLIPTFNRATVLRRTLLLYERQQAMNLRFEVLVVDDGSSDGTPALLDAMTPEVRYPMRWFSLPGNAGPSAARNRAIDEARGRVLLFTGDDILPDERLLAEHMEWHDQRHPASHVGVLGRVQWAEELASTPFMRWLEASGTQFGYGRLAHGDAVDYGYLYTSNVSVKRDFILATNERFDERLRFCEDSEWGLRLARKGFELRYNSRARGAHLHPTTVDSSIRRMRALGEAAATLRDVSPENFQRVTNGFFEPGRSTRLRLLRAALHPVIARTLYLPLARLCERRIVADKLFAACHAAYFLDALLGATRR